MIVIIGAGISGLALAHHLEARGRPFVVLEASDRVGGVMRSGRVEAGPAEQQIGVRQVEERDGEVRVML